MSFFKKVGNAFKKVGSYGRKFGRSAAGKTLITVGKDAATAALIAGMGSYTLPEIKRIAKIKRSFYGLKRKYKKGVKQKVGNVVRTNNLSSFLKRKKMLYDKDYRPVRSRLLSQEEALGMLRDLEREQFEAETKRYFSDYETKLRKKAPYHAEPFRMPKSFVSVDDLPDYVDTDGIPMYEPMEVQ